jgi:pimeloyl-ACP methyl ester carboxylesterase
VDLGCRVIALSRPGYGLTDVGRASPARFAALADEVRETLQLNAFLAVVGTSFGGPQAVEYAGRFPTRARSLVLHSAAPSTRPYPDSAAERRLAPIIFSPLVERYVWSTVAGLMHRAPTLGLRLMMASLSTRRDGSWLQALEESERREIREVFCAMRSRSGFVTDLRYSGERSRVTRRLAQQRVSCPALITASHQDGGVAWEHAEDFFATIADARLVEIPAASHLFWIGPTKMHVSTVVHDFLATVDLSPHD